ncbi:hypothetical protein [Mycobacterium tuberculosis]|uniref:hypothetical protein n=1 Tax=Mycobacterium tuberculosis TaxID=1773 RepID=UPI00272CDDFA|nr:hypothetical protein [Mycobacterium tuberculosis]
MNLPARRSLEIGVLARRAVQRSRFYESLNLPARRSLEIGVLARRAVQRSRFYESFEH